MRFLIVRKADNDTEAGMPPSQELLEDMAQYIDTLAAEGRLHTGEGLKPSSQGVRVTFANGQATVVDGPFAETKELVAGLSIIEAESLDDAVDWVRGWPTIDGHGEVCLDIRSMGCPGGLPGFSNPDNDDEATKPRFAVLLKSDDDAERDVDPGPVVLGAMADGIRAGIEAGFLLAGEGLRSSASAKRVRFSGGKPEVIDGPFAEVKELVAGYWILRMASIDDVIEWVKGYPFPNRHSARVEIRQLYEVSELVSAAT
ncbi:hypothetical protein EC912_102808 [Luteibacter rhizovicinus]|uniref:YCII-related domain-containing protein n=1 Tax=Luteibacter rhizovicinus TaxID=242606 RepID=A0A4R3YU10_9GAMM|nr:YciI family protein [Luteibacter rhizovicinus]TCV96457.1 hypothetical protein EC912_102808 [Luteibacter rhizovicinus]